MEPSVFFFGCWNQAGHFLFHPSSNMRFGKSVHDDRSVVYYDKGLHLDGTLAPRRMRNYYGGGLCWAGMAGSEKRDRITYDSDEYDEGQFLHHHLPNGYTAIQWWDRHQGDTRGACNSTFLMVGQHTVEAMMEALPKYFPHVLANLEKAGLKLIEVKKENLAKPRS